MMNPLLRFALGLASMPDKTVEELDGSLPGFSRISAFAKELEPMIQQALPLIDQATPHVQALLPILEKLLPIAQQAWPIVKAAYPDIVAVTPTVQDLIEFARRK
jgi:hypothetical protein